MVSTTIINSFNKNAPMDAFLKTFAAQYYLTVAVIEISSLFLEGGMWVESLYQLGLNSIN